MPPETRFEDAHWFAVRCHRVDQRVEHVVLFTVVSSIVLLPIVPYV
jgi:hypothetical protein